ncbi:S1C family serine protease [Prochlorococcus sp. MIT 1341]|uniref:S1C family serine protease n=1 Tax=Prochlorococcus sp. MIT 1341 TaxID=3096221 RepID=UPI002A74F1B4|nr:S1C family serine protease [Prochlorococcus sp. MIT 1341]
MRKHSIAIALSLGVATASGFLLLLSQKAYTQEQQQNKINCSSPVYKRSEECKKSNKGTHTTDEKTGLPVIEFLKDIDWKSKGRSKIPWSKIVKVTSALDGEYQLAVFDRDFTDSFNTGAKEGVVTKWTTDLLRGYTYSAGGCGFWTCTYTRGEINDLPDVVELYVASKSFRLYGSSGEFPIPQGFIDLIKKSNENTEVNLKLKGGSKSVVVPIGKGTIESLKKLFSKAIQTWAKPTIRIKPQSVSKSSLSTEDIATKSLPGVVMLKNDRGLGSGFIINNNGLVVTNRHVVAGGDRKFQIIAQGGLKADGKVIYVDRKLDFALVNSKPLKRIKPLPLCFADYPIPGQRVVALGSPDGLAGTVTEGIVSAIRYPSGQLEGVAPNYVTLIQTDASISPGNSGGPLLNNKGEVIGINTFNVPMGGRGQNLNFAVSIVDVLRAVEAQKPEKADRGWFKIFQKTVNRCGNLM